MTAVIRLTRDSVAAGDDCDAPHSRVERLGNSIRTPEDLQDAVARIAVAYLPSVAGQASWAAYSRLPIAVLSNDGSAVRKLWLMRDDLRRLDIRGGELHLHYVYLGTRDPEVAFDVIRCTMSAFRS